MEIDKDLIRMVHQELKGDKNCSFALFKFGYEDNWFPVYSRSNWMLNLIQIMANPYLKINVTFYSILFGNKCNIFNKTY